MPAVIIKPGLRNRGVRDEAASIKRIRMKLRRPRSESDAKV
jgi:hypothetical protein